MKLRRLAKELIKMQIYCGKYDKSCDGCKYKSICTQLWGYIPSRHDKINIDDVQKGVKL